MKNSLVCAMLFVTFVSGKTFAQATAAAPAQAPPATTTTPDTALVHINSASEAELAKLPGIGPAKAKAIIAARPFQSVDDLKKVKGIKEAVFAKIKDKVTL